MKQIIVNFKFNVAQELRTFQERKKTKIFYETLIFIYLLNSLIDWNNFKKKSNMSQLLTVDQRI